MHKRKKLYKYGEILEQIGPLVEEIEGKQVSRSSRRHLVFGKMCFATVRYILLIILINKW
jgi:hypothetical protein